MLTHTPSSSTHAVVKDQSTRRGRVRRIVLTVLLTLSVLLMVGYTAALGPDTSGS